MSMGNSSEVIEEIDDDSKISARESMEGNKEDDCTETSSTWHFLQLQHKLHHLVSCVLVKHLHHEAADLPLMDPITDSLTGVLVEDKPGARRHLVHQHGQGELVRLVQECQEL